MQNLPITNEDQTQIKLPDLNEYSNIVRSKSNENYDIKSMKSSFSSSTTSLSNDFNIRTNYLTKYSFSKRQLSTNKALSLPDLTPQSHALFDQNQNFQFTDNTTRIKFKNSIESATQTENTCNYKFNKDSGIEVNHTQYGTDSSSAQSSIIDSSDLVILNTIREESSPDLKIKFERYNEKSAQEKRNLFKETILNERKIDDTDSFESVSSLSNHERANSLVNTIEFEIKQKNLRHYEVLFNEIALAYNSNQNRLKESISLYQEKYHKADYMTNLLFDNLMSTLNVSFSTIH